MRPVFAALAAVLVFGPPQINVTKVEGTPPVPGAVLLVAGHHHTDEREPDITGRAIAMRNGERITRPVTLTKYGERGQYAVTKQWDDGTAWVLLFTIKQGDHSKFNTAETMVKVSAAGAVVSIDKILERGEPGQQLSRAATDAEITAALRSLGVR